MPEINQIYKCSVCGNIVEIINAGGDQLVCCNKQMELQEAHLQDAPGNEKHVPVIEKTATGYKIKIGSIPHPMEKEHYIQWIEIIANGISYKKFLQPGDAPEAEFCLNAKKITARDYCNIHGLWSK